MKQTKNKETKQEASLFVKYYRARTGRGQLQSVSSFEIRSNIGHRRWLYRMRWKRLMPHYLTFHYVEKDHFFLLHNVLKKD